MAIAIVEARKVAIQLKVMSVTEVGISRSPSTSPGGPR